VSIAKEVEGVITELAGPVEFEVVKLFEGTLKGMDAEDLLAFRNDVNLMREALSAASITFDENRKKVKAFETALSRMDEPAGDLYEELYMIKRQMAEYNEKIWGDPAKRELSVYDYPSVGRRFDMAAGGTYNLNYGPTGQQLKSLEIAKEQFEAVKAELEILVNETIPAYEQKLIDAGAPWMNGQPLK
jgi:hypothetical protein